MEKYKPKILFMEAQESRMGHRRLNAVLLKQFLTFAETTSVFPEKWLYDLGVIPTINYIPIFRVFRAFPNFFVQFIKSIKTLYFAKKLHNTEHFDYIFFSSYNIFSLPFILILLKNPCRIFLLHHALLDQIDEKKIKATVKKWCFMTVLKRVHHVFIEEFPAQEFMRRYSISQAFVHWFPHPYNKNERKQQTVLKYDYVGISNSNDEEWLHSIIQEEMLHQTIKKSGLRILLRSGRYSFDNGFLRVFNGLLNDEEYNNIILSAKKMLVPFPETFKYRVSGTVVDALSNEISVIGSKIPIIELYAKKYPHVCKVGITLDNIITYRDTNNTSEALLEFNMFASEHTTEKLTNALKGMFLKKC